MIRIIMILVLTCALFSQKLYDREPLSPRNANYEIDVRLDDKNKILYGNQVIRWRNISNIETNELWFHLYLNAFASERTTFSSEYGGTFRGSKMDPKEPGWQRIKTFKVDGEDLHSRLEFRQPDDGNIHDSTVVMLTLDRIIKPGDEIVIEMEFEARLPKVYARTGFFDKKDKKDVSRYFLVAQWFPKIAVLENRGWNCHQFHGNTEFFADYGEYHVRMTLPKEYVVGASGEFLSKEETDKLATHHYYVNDVHDFAWTAFKDFEITEDEHKGIQIKLLYDPDMYDSGTKEQHLAEQMQAVKYGIDFYANFGMYPHPTITMLNPPAGDDGSGGMEYPTFFTNGYSSNVPDGILLRSEFVTIHEYGHQIFQGVLGSNEMEHSWMDEGVNSYADAGTVDTHYGGAIKFKGMTLKTYDLYRFMYLQGPNYHPVMMTSYLQNPSYYGTNSYARPGVLMKTLENYVGQEKFFAAMKHYYEKWKFDHPYPQDMFDALQEKIDVDITWYFKQYFYENKVFDYDVEMIGYSPVDEANFVPLARIQVLDSAEMNSDELFLNRFRIVNHGDGWFPMDLVVTMEDGTEITDLKWDHKASFNIVDFYASKRIESVQLDPERKAIIELNFHNNGRTMKPVSATAKYVNRWMYWIQNLSQFLIGF